jgi:hypothetical protein
MTTPTLTYRAAGDTACPKAPCGRHIVGHENIGDNPLRGVCLECRQPVRRAHRKSPWWFTEHNT